jgi:hypothetical protein
MRRPYLNLLLAPVLLGLLGTSVTTLTGQETVGIPIPTVGGQDTASSLPARPAHVVDSVDLVFEREAFVYPRYDRRNPFLPLVTGDEQGPRFEEIRLTGIIYSSTPQRSVAMFGLRTGQEQEPDGRGAASQSYRVRMGETLGNVRILEIHPTRVVVLVEEFGLTEQRILELPRPGEGGL